MNEEKKWNTTNLLKILSIVLVVIFLVILFHMNQSIQNMKQELSHLRLEVNGLHGSVSSQIGNITANIETSLKKENSIVADYSYRVEADKINRTERTLPLSLTVTPKEYKTGLKALFTVETEDGRIITATGEAGDGYVFQATIDVPMDYYLKLGVTFDDGTLQRSEVLEELYSLPDQYVMKVDSIWNGTVKSESHKGQLNYEGTVETHIATDLKGRNYPASGEVQLLKNGTLIKKFPIPLEDENIPLSGDNNPAKSQVAPISFVGNDITYFTYLAESVSYKNNDKIEILVIVKDNLGLTYHQIVRSEYVDASGRFETDHSFRGVEVSD